VAIAGADEIGRDTPDEAYWQFRDEKIARGDDFLRLSRLLCTLPRVSLAKHPSRLTQACDATLDLEVEEEVETLILTLPQVDQLVSNGQLTLASKTLKALLSRWLELGDLVPPHNWHALKKHLETLRPDLGADVRSSLVERGAWPHD